MSSYILRTVGQKTPTPGIFNLVPYNGAKPISTQENGYSVNDGICYSTFSYNSGSYIPIKKMNESFSVGKDYAVYIEFGIGGAIPQVTGASVTSSVVGRPTTNPNNWPTYPDFYQIRPTDKTEKIDGKTVVTKIADGKRQEKCYLLLGKCYDQVPSYEKSNKYTAVSSLANKWSGYFVQYVNTNIILMGSQVSGVPVVFPMPFWNGPGTSDSNQLFPK